MLKPALCLSLFLGAATPAQTPTKAPAPHTPESPRTGPSGTWILQIEGDALGLKVSGATHKKFRYRGPRRVSWRYRVSVFDAAGKLLGAAPLDLTDFCLHPAHRGQKDHVTGDVIIKHDVVTTVKVPAFDKAAEIRIARVDAGKLVVLGRIDRKTLTGMIVRKEVR